jgi:hypothetical protein
MKLLLKWLFVLLVSNILIVTFSQAKERHNLAKFKKDNSIPNPFNHQDPESSTYGQTQHYSEITPDDEADLKKKFCPNFKEFLIQHEQRMALRSHINLLVEKSNNAQINKNISVVDTTNFILEHLSKDLNIINSKYEDHLKELTTQIKEWSNKKWPSAQKLYENYTTASNELVLTTDFNSALNSIYLKFKECQGITYDHFQQKKILYENKSPSAFTKRQWALAENLCFDSLYTSLENIKTKAQNIIPNLNINNFPIKFTKSTGNNAKIIDSSEKLENLLALREIEKQINAHSRPQEENLKTINSILDSYYNPVYLKLHDLCKNFTP